MVPRRTPRLRCHIVRNPSSLHQLMAVRTCPSFQKLDDPDQEAEANEQTLGTEWESVPKWQLYLIVWPPGTQSVTASTPGMAAKGELSVQMLRMLGGCSADILTVLKPRAMAERDRQSAIRCMSLADKERRTPLFYAFLWLEAEMRTLGLRESLITDVYRRRLGVAAIAGVSEQAAWQLATSLRNGYVQMFLELYAYNFDEDSDEFRSIADAVHQHFSGKQELGGQPPNNAGCASCASCVSCGATSDKDLASYCS